MCNFDMCHRVTNFIRSNNKVFIFPGKDEVWTVYSRQTWSPFFVVSKIPSLTGKHLYGGLVF